MRRVVLFLVCVWPAFLAPTSGAGAQEPEPACAGQGAEPPRWYVEPPAPPRAVYQAESRSGGCPDAETAQTVAARVAARLLLQARSTSSVLTEVRMSRRQQGTGSRTEIEHDYQVLERAFTQKVMDRSWVHRQETRWTTEGRAEHFLILRADTSAVRDVAEEELAGLTSGGAGTSAGRDDFDWVSLEGTEDGASRSPTSTGPAVASNRGSPSGNPFADLAPPNLRRLVVEWQASPQGPDARAWPWEGRAGLALGTDGTGFYGALGAGLSEGAPRSVGGGQGIPSLRITEDRSLDAFGLFGLPYQLVPVYAGYRYRWLRADSNRSQPGGGREALVIGLGYPFFTELTGARLKNRYVEAVVRPDLQAVEGGGRVGVLQGSRVHVNAVVRGNLGVAELRHATRFQSTGAGGGSGALLLDRLALDAGLEVRLSDHVGAFALGRFDRIRLSRVQDRDGDRYSFIFRPMEAVGDSRTKVQFQVGMRLSV